MTMKWVLVVYVLATAAVCTYPAAATPSTVSVCPGKTVTFSQEVNDVAFVRVALNGHEFCEFHRAYEPIPCWDQNLAVLITAEISFLENGFANFNIQVTAHSISTGLTFVFNYVTIEGDVEEITDLMVRTTSAPSITSIMEESVKSVSITLGAPAEGSECVEDYIIQYEGGSNSTGGTLSVVIENVVFCNVTTFNVTAVLGDGSVISGVEYNFTPTGESCGDGGLDGGDGGSDDGEDLVTVLIGVIVGGGGLLLIVGVIVGLIIGPICCVYCYHKSCRKPTKTKRRDRGKSRDRRRVTGSTDTRDDPTNRSSPTTTSDDIELRAILPTVVLDQPEDKRHIMTDIISKGETESCHDKDAKGNCNVTAATSVVPDLNTVHKP